MQTELLLLGITSIIIVMLIILYIGWLQLRIWFMNQLIHRPAVMLTNPSEIPKAENNRGCFTKILFVIFLMFIPVAILIRMVELS